MAIITTIVVSLVVAVISTVLSELLKPPPDIQNAKPAGQGDFKLPTAQENRPIPLIWGRVKQSGPNVTWWGDIKTIKIREKIKTGLFSSKKVTTGFRYFVGVQFSLCRGPIDAVTKIWMGDKIAYDNSSFTFGTLTIDKPALFGGVKFGTGGIQGDVDVTQGTETETTNTYLGTQQSPSLPYRGTCLAIFKQVFYGTSTQIKPAAFEVARFPNGLSLLGGKHIINLDGANMANVVYEILTNNEWGFGQPASIVDVANFTAAADTLHSEGNGFAMLLDRQLSAQEILDLVQDQMGGVAFLDIEDEKYKIKLARDDYDIDTVPQLTDDTIVEIREFTRGTWEDTANHIRVEFTDRARNYFDTYATTSDISNQRIQNGQVVSSVIKYPGIKDKTLAQRVASRDLRELSIPRSKATILVDRTFHSIKPGDVVALTEDNVGLVKLPMRVMRIGYGSLESGAIELGLAEDVFRFDASVFGDPDDTLWVPPSTDVNAPPLSQQLVFESPRGITRRDPETPETFDRVWAGLRRQGAEIAFKIHQRSASGTPAGAYIEDSDDVPEFILMGTVRDALVPGPAQGITTITVNQSPDFLADLQAAFSQSVASADVGQNLTNLCMIGSDPATAEFVCPLSSTNQTTHLDLENCWRGLLDTTPRDHAVGTPVYLIFNGGEMNLSALNRGYNVDVQLRGSSLSDTLTEIESVTTALTLIDRHRRPIPPTEMEVNGVAYDALVDPDALKTGGSGEDGKGIEVEFTRRDYVTYDEVEGIQTDAETLDDNFPTKNTTQYQTKATAVVGLDALLQGIRGHWKMEEANGATRFDATENNSDLGNFGAVNQSVSGKIGNAADFAGGYLHRNTDTEFMNDGGSFHLCAWVNLDDKLGTQTIIGKWFEDSNRRQFVVDFDNSADRFRLRVSADGTAVTTLAADSLGSPSAAIWYFVQAWHDADQCSINLRVNDGKVDTLVYTGGIHTSTAVFRLGAINNALATADNFLDGKLDTVTVYDRVLSGPEQMAHFSNDAGSEFPFGAVDAPDADLSAGLIGYYKHDEAALADIVDSTVNRVTLTNNGGVLSGTGKIGNATRYDGTNDKYFEAPNSTLYDIGNEDFTIAIWVNLDTKTSIQAIASKWNANLSQVGWLLFYRNDLDRFELAVSADGTTTVTRVQADTLGAVSTGTWYFIVAKHEAGVGLSISVNGGAEDTAAHTMGVFEGGQPFRFGILRDGAGNLSNRFDGLIDETGMWRRLLTSGEITTMYNSTLGRTTPFASGTFRNTTPDALLDWNSGEASAFFSRAKLVREFHGLPDGLDIQIGTRHTFDGEVLTASQDLGAHEATLDIQNSELLDDEFVGVLDDNDVSRSFKAPTTGTYALTLGTALATGIVEARLNGGAWSTIIAATLITGNLAGVTAGDTIEVRHTQSGTGSTETWLKIDAPSTTADAYGVLVI